HQRVEPGLQVHQERVAGRLRPPDHPGDHRAQLLLADAVLRLDPLLLQQPELVVAVPGPAPAVLPGAVRAPLHDPGRLGAQRHPQRPAPLDLRTPASHLPSPSARPGPVPVSAFPGWARRNRGRRRAPVPVARDLPGAEGPGRPVTFGGSGTPPRPRQWTATVTT